MRLVVVSSAPIVVLNEKKYMYGPYQKEMRIWAKYIDEIQFCCPIWKEDKGLLIDEVSFPILNTIKLKEFHVKSLTNIPFAIYYSIINLYIIVKSMYQADHIHLRCPGNMGLLACFVQILFPYKKKTAKYAGNWDPNAKQPFTYKLQRWILSNTFLTRNMQVLVYGEWANQTKNIKPFFTATYSESEMQGKSYEVRSIEDKILKFLFVGTLSKGKQPLYAIQLVEKLHQQGKNVRLNLFGEGILRDNLEQYISENKIESIVFFKGNQSKETILRAYQTAQFLILPSISEGWPKVVAEAMFWGCVPIVSSVSCTPNMLGNGTRGILLEQQLEKDLSLIIHLLSNKFLYQKMASEAQNWSRQFTTDRFEEEIKKVIIKKY